MKYVVSAVDRPNGYCGGRHYIPQPRTEDFVMKKNKKRKRREYAGNRRVSRTELDEYTVHLRCTPKQMDILMKIAVCHGLPDIGTAFSATVRMICDNPLDFVPCPEIYKDLDLENPFPEPSDLSN